MSAASWRTLVAVTLAFLCVAANSRAQLQARRLASAPRIDGVLDAGEWSNATQVDDFWNVADQRPALNRTVCLMAFDNSNVYFAFECSDPDPAGIRRAETRTNAVTAADDVVAVGVDPTGRHLDPYWFYVNARGTHRIDVPSESGDPNLRWQGMWESAARVTASGWTAEIRIPVTILRPPRGQSTFGIILVRIMPRTQHFYTFPRMRALPMDESNSVLWTGIQMDSLRYVPIVKPFIKADTLNGGSQYAGLDARYVDPNGMTAMLTLKPDFDDIARDVESINFTYTERYLRETRSFFLDGAGYFPRDAVFYSPRLQTIGGGLKAFGRAGALEYAGLGVGSGDEYSGAARLRYQLQNRTFVYADSVVTTSPAYSNEVFGLGMRTSRALPDGELGLGGFYYHSSDVGASDHYALVEMYRTASNLRPSFTAGYEDVGPNFYPALGFMPEVGFRSVYAVTNIQSVYDRGPLFMWGAEGALIDRQRYGGGTLDRAASASLYATFRNEVAARVITSYLRRPPHTDRINGSIVQWKSLRPRDSGLAFVYTGKQNGGDSTYYGVQQNVQVAGSASLSLAYAHIDLRYGVEDSTPDYVASQLICTLRYDLSPDSGVAGRYVGEGRYPDALSDTNNFYLSYWNRVRRGADIFLIWGLPNADRFTDRFAIKLQMPLEFGL